MGYYTGIVFNGMCSKAGDFIINGGRYDKLMGFPAVGFVVNIDAVTEIVDYLDEQEKNGYYIIGNDYTKMFDAKNKYFNIGARVEISTLALTVLEEKKYAVSKGFKYLVDTNTQKVEEI